MSRAMKDSGIEWIGSIPEHWEVKRLKNVADLNPTFNAQIEQDTLVAYMPMECLRNGIIQERIASYSEVASYTPFKDGDVVMAKVTPCFENGNIAVANNLQGGYGFGTSEIFVIRCCKEAHNKYAFYYLQSAYIKNLGVSSMTGTGGLKRVNPTILNNSYFISPSVAEQQAIADYLDEKCAEVDEMIALQEQIIEELKAYKQSVITEAVTKGLNPATPMRDSGIEWIGQIPEHWEVKRLKYLCSIKTGNKDTQDADKDGAYPFYVRSPFVERSTSYSFEGEGILMAGDGAGAGRVFHHAFGKYAVHQRVYRLSDIKHINSNYLFYYISNLFNKVMDMGSAQSTVPSVRLPMLTNFRVCCPDIEKQQAIADYLDEKCADIDSLIQTKQSKIDSLKEYKKSIIYEYVTGKREVE